MVTHYVTVTLDAQMHQPRRAGNKRITTGVITMSALYDTGGGDTIPAGFTKFGLGSLERLYIWPYLGYKLQPDAAGSAPTKILAYLSGGAESTSVDLSSVHAQFMAVGR